MPQRPATLLAAAVVLAVESLGVLAGAVAVGVDTAAGHAYQVGSGVALTLIALVAATGLGLVTSGLARSRPWSRTPATLVQIFVGVVAVYLLQGHRYEWGTPMIVLAVAGIVTLFAPPTMRALVRDRKPG